MPADVKLWVVRLDKARLASEALAIYDAEKDRRSERRWQRTGCENLNSKSDW
jgi:hypothetical protein